MKLPQESRSQLVIVAQGIDGGIAPLASALAHGIIANGNKCSVRYVGRPAQSQCVDADCRSGIDSAALVTGKARSCREVFGLLRSVVNIFKTVIQNQPSVIVFAGFIPALLYPVILRPFTKAKFIFWDHAPQNTFLKIKQAIFPLSLQYMERIISISPSTAAATANYFGVKPDAITIIPNGVDPVRWAALPAAPQLETLRIIMPARLDLNQKDPITLIRAAAVLHKQGVQVQVTLVGSGVDEPVIAHEIKRQNARSYIRLLAHTDALPNLVASSNVVCLSTKFEGLPTVVIEAMLARRVVLASRVAGCVDIVNDGVNGFLFDAGSVDDCVAKLKIIKNLPDVSEVVSNAFAEALESYTPQAMVTRFSEVLALTSRGAFAVTLHEVQAPNIEEGRGYDTAVANTVKANPGYQKKIAA